MSAKRGMRMGKVGARILATSLALSFVSSLPAMAAGDGHGRSHRAAAAADSTGDWLAEINRYRAATDLALVSDNPSWDAGLQAHLTYLEKTPPQYFVGQYQSKHTENPASPYYTAAGATEAGSSDLEWGGASSPLAAIDWWLRAPFHAIGMLRAQLAQVALADDPSTGYAALDVIQGLDYGLPAATSPILFPGPGITTNLLTYSGDESPNPLQTCGWQNLTAPVGLPLIMLLTQAPASGLSATVAGPGGTESTTVGDLCVVDENTYRSSDPVYGPTGLQILQGDNAVILIPRRPLVAGTYSVSVQQTGDPDIDWSFSAQAPVTVERPAPSGPPVHTPHVTKITKVTVHGHSARIVITAPAGVKLRCALAPQHGSHWRRVRFATCRRTMVYHRLRCGRYRMTVHSSAGNPSRVLLIT